MERDTSVIDMINRAKIGRIYKEMLKACNQKGTKYYRLYGKLGYTVSPEWERSPVQFFTKFAINYKAGDKLCIRKGKSIFSQENCRWLSPAELIKIRREETEVFYMSEWMPIGDLCDRLEITPAMVKAKYETRKKDYYKDEDNRDFEPVRW